MELGPRTKFVVFFSVAIGTPPPTITQHSAEVSRLFQEGVSKREIARRIGISRASVRNLLGDGNP